MTLIMNFLIKCSKITLHQLLLDVCIILDSDNKFPALINKRFILKNVFPSAVTVYNSHMSVLLRIW